LIEALGAIHSTSAFGARYYAALAKKFGRTLGRLLRHKKIYRPTWTDLVELAPKAAKLVGARDALEPAMLIEELGDFETITGTAAPERTIDVSRMFDEGAYVYFAGDSLNDQTEITVLRFGIWAFVSEAVRRYHRGESSTQLVLSVDEAPEFYSNQFARLCCQARKFNIALLAAMQHFHSPGKNAIDIAHVFTRNFATQLYFTAFDEDIIKLIQSLSKDERVPTETSETNKPFDFAPSVTTSFLEQPRFQRNDCLDASEELFHCVALIRDGKSHREPIHMKVVPPCDPQTAKRRTETPLPPSRNATSIEPADNPKRELPKQCQAAFTALWDAKDASLAWETKS